MRGATRHIFNFKLILTHKTMKYIDADKLKAEIDKRLSIFEHGMAYDCWASCKKVVESLQQEQPDNEDIDKVAQELYEHLYELKRRNNLPTNLYDKQEIIALWKAGVEYAYNHPKQEQPEVDLEIAKKVVIELHPVMEYCTSMELGIGAMIELVMHGYKLGLNARKEE